MKQTKTEIIAFNEINKAVSWEDLFRILNPKLSSLRMEEVIEISITANSLKVTKLVEENA